MGMHLVSAREQELHEIGAVLTAGSGNQGASAQGIASSADMDRGEHKTRPIGIDPVPIRKSATLCCTGSYASPPSAYKLPAAGSLC